ncbi:MAG: type IV pilin protein [Pseudomonadota bacterium]
MKMLFRQKGITLIELMIALAIAGIVATIAYPSYQGYLTKAARGTAQSDLMAFATAMERHSASTFSYSGAAIGGADTGKPAIFAAHSPASEMDTKKKYDLTISAIENGGNSYVIIATPVTDSVTDGDGVLYYYSDGRKGWDQDGSGMVDSDEFCWAC